jgi:hypothetical protein
MEALRILCTPISSDPVVLPVTHVLDPFPIETHVFMSLNYQAPVIVITARSNFFVQGTTLRFLGEGVVFAGPASD